MITLSDGQTIVELPEDLYWSDEFIWSAVEQSAIYSVTGALIIQTGKKLAGRPITLQSHDGQSAVASRETMAKLQAWRNTPSQRLTLDMPDYGHTATVMFRHQDGAVEAEPLVFYSDPVSGDYVFPVLRFFEV